MQIAFLIGKKNKKHVLVLGTWFLMKIQKKKELKLMKLYEKLELKKDCHHLFLLWSCTKIMNKTKIFICTVGTNYQVFKVQGNARDFLLPF